MKKIAYTLLLLSFVIMLASWGSVGHQKISGCAQLSFGTQMSQFNQWTSKLVAHASDADDRKSTDPDEAPKHFIDIDSYYEFNTTGKIAQTLDSVITLHGLYFVYNNGILPYATKTTFDTLKACFQRNDWAKAVLTAADLGHYVGDGHMPLHITKNYDGQETGNDGIHSRYETSMIDYYVSQIIYSGDTLAVIPNVTQYIFDYLYVNYTYIDSVLAADTYAKGIASNVNTMQYKQALWLKSGGFTTTLFRNASHALAELIYTAWVQAGSPSILNTINSYNPSTKEFQIENFPNPFSNSTHIKLNLQSGSELDFCVKDINGNIITVLENGYKTSGTYLYEWTPSNLPSGNYFLELRKGKIIQEKRLVFVK